MKEAGLDEKDFNLWTMGIFQTERMVSAKGWEWERQRLLQRFASQCDWRQAGDACDTGQEGLGSHVSQQKSTDLPQ